MYQGKYQKPVPMKKHSSKRSILVISLVLLLVAVVGGTVAYLMDATNPVENTFSPAKVQIIPNESKTETSKSNITFTNPKVDENGNNLNTVPVYIRATLVIYWKDKDGMLVPKPAGGDVQIGAVNNTDGWFEINGTYYYSKKVVPGAETPNMLKADITVPGSDPEAKAEVVVSTVAGYTCYVDIRAEAIQAEPDDAVTAAWKGVKVDVDANGNKLLKAE